MERTPIGDSHGPPPAPRETMDDDTDDKDDTKRKSRNLSEKKRRDQFNMLVNELGSMVSANARKMDKSTVLKSTILFLKNHNEIAVRSRVHEIQEDWKPSFLSNEEFTHLILEALDGFIMVFSSNGRIYYASESVTSLLGYLPSELANSTIYEIAYQGDQSHLYNILLNPGDSKDQNNIKKENQVSFTCHIKRGGLDFKEEPIYELVQFMGYFRSDVDTDIDSLIPSSRFGGVPGSDTKLVFVGTGRLQTPLLIREMSVVDSAKSEFTSRHSLEWKFLFLDHRAPPIIGYLPFEVLGTSGYDYYHVDDLDNVVTCHESLMQKGEGTSCHYRFLTKGQQWIWLQTRFYITYNQWNSKPEFIVCTHNVVSYVDVMKQMRKERTEEEEFEKSQNSEVPQSSSKHQQQQQQQLLGSSQSSKISTPPWSSKSSKASRSAAMDSRPRYHSARSDTTTMSASSQGSRHSHATTPTGSRPSKVSSVGSTAGKLTAERPEVEQPCPNFLEPSHYVAAIPVQPVTTTGFGAPSTQIISTLPNPETLQQQGIVMTPTQNQIQDELQRKHEELQQLIVHQQEELRKVSEQLLIARYGILSPLLNVGMQYNANPCQPSGRCVGSPSSSNSTTARPLSSPGVQGVNVLPVPITLPIVSAELFPHALPVSPVPASSGFTHANIGQLMPGQHVSPTPSAPQQQTQQQSVQQESQPTELISFQMCQPSDVMCYTSMEPPVNAQQRPAQN